MLILKVLSTLMFASIGFAQETKPLPGHFDSYVLAMSYMNDFCISHPAKVECKTPLDHPEMVLHGLWPNLKADPQHRYQYCSISEAEFGKDWCKAEFDVSSMMDPFTFAFLSDVMPGAQSCLYNHEWYAHGSCSGLTVESYYRTSIYLAKKFRSLPSFNAFLVNSYGKSVSRSEFFNALKADLGEKAEKAIAIQCRWGKNAGKRVPYFSEVHITLQATQFETYAKPSTLGTKEFEGSCPEKDIQILNAPPAPSGTPIDMNDPSIVKNPCPCAQFPGKSFCRSFGFSLNKDGSITNYKPDGTASIVQGPFASVQEFIDQQVCK